MISPAEKEIERLANYILAEFPDEPGSIGKSESAVDVAIRLLKPVGISCKSETLINGAITDFEFSVRTSNILRYAGIETMRDLVKCSERDILKLKNAGQKTLNEIKDFLKGCNLKLENRL